MPSALLILEDPPRTTLDLVAGEVTVSQQLPPRLAIVEGETAELEAIRNLPGVRAVCEQGVTGSLLAELRPDERTFAEAWALTRRPKAARVGDTLPWDAEGFEPPDRLD